MGVPYKPICPVRDGFCFTMCAWWTGSMCSVKGIGMVLEKFLESDKCDLQLSDKVQSVKDIPKI